MPVAESQTEEKRVQLPERVLPGRVPGERKSHKRPFLWIDLLRFATAAIKVADRCPVRPQTLFQPLPNPTFCFLPKVPNEVRGNNRLDIGGEPAAARTHIEIVAREVAGIPWSMSSPRSAQSFRFRALLSTL